MMMLVTIRFCADTAFGVRPVGSPIGGWIMDGVAGAFTDALSAGSINVLIEILIGFKLLS